ncbi:MAG: hypothetical protein CML13_12295 [Puniceicoccaceae bacterium]|nr:hypothetical protein [Puniceicoccaceae bacterium]|tara:strand:+ start:519 stop:1283 length:765 start_codon:yes stop_codon:yes gene_type:complete
MKKNTHSAFTLIELLTVIAVIAVLAAILIPAIGTVRMNALETQGLSNIRQVGMSYLMVAQEDGGILPSVYGDEKKDLWDRQVNAILINEQPENYPSQWSETFKDPAAIARGVISEENTSKWHFAPLGAITRAYGDDGTASDPGSGAAPKALRAYNRILKHQHPDRQILLADAGVGSPDDAVWGDLLHSESFSWSGNWNGRVDSGKANDPIDPGANTGGDIRWMEGEAKFFFLDGHVEKRQQNEVYNKNLNPLYL